MTDLLYSASSVGGKDAESPSSFASSPAPSVPPPEGRKTTLRLTISESDEAFLFNCFPSYTWAQWKRGLSSWAWDHGYDIQKGSEYRWVCRRCIDRRAPVPESFNSQGLQNAMEHLYEDHTVPAPESETKSKAQRKAEKIHNVKQQSLHRFLSSHPENPRDQAITNSFLKNFNKETFHRLLLEWIIEENLPFTTVQHRKLRAAFEYFNPCIKDQTAHISNTELRKRVIQEFLQHKETIIQTLKASPGRIHISFDGWRSGNCCALYGVVVFFRDESNKPCKLVIGIPEVSTRHTGQNIATQVIEVLKTFQIEHKIGLFTLDNAANMDTTLDEIGHTFGFNGEKRRGCPVGKAHNLVVDIWRSDRLYYILLDVQQTGLVSTKAMAKRPRILKEENQLNDHDWAVLEHTAAILTHYESAVKLLEGDGIQRKRRGWTGSYGNIWEVIFRFEFLLAKLEEYKAIANTLPDSNHFRANINLGWQKLDEYYKKLDETPVYYAAVALHSRFRWNWFENKWADRPEWVQMAKNLVQELWNTEYRDLEIGKARIDGEPAQKRQKTDLNPFEEFIQQQASSAPIQPTLGDEYQASQTLETVNTEVIDPITYWHERRHQYPRLSQMALDILTVQPMSAECERLFSAAGQMTSPLRNALDAMIIGICQVLRSWLRAGVIKGLDPVLLSLDEKDEVSKVSKMSAKELKDWATAWLIVEDQKRQEVNEEWL
ncbi:hypothetical protein NPX13_g2213 [Xylaria arbuscula]|uniref:HAT C-terminal dimerisation domain-containing protein n=1 Tax=Xylaria arbuscula TaxID=114810 RepID=A0A9W8NK79_9PEZI|nr:hypothetical protein NPX13_g2213 [Xylaria arbuscula]